MILVYNRTKDFTIYFNYLIHNKEMCNMKRIKQINESKELILKAFIRILEKKKFEDITISDIAKEAGVVRMTFYRHFDKKEDIIIFIFEQHVDKALNIMEKKGFNSTKDLLNFRFQTIKESPYIELILNHNELNKLFQTLGKKNIHQFKALIPDLNDIYKASFMNGGINAMTKLWIQNGMKESPEEMSTKVMKILNLFQENR